MAIVNGGYAKITKRLFAFEIRTPDNCSYGEFAHAVTRREACAIAMRGKDKADRIAHVWDEDTMAPSLLEQARDWLRNPPVKSYMPSRSEPYLDRG